LIFSRQHFYGGALQIVGLRLDRSSKIYRYRRSANSSQPAFAGSFEGGVIGANVRQRQSREKDFYAAALVRRGPAFYT